MPPPLSFANTSRAAAATSLAAVAADPLPSWNDGTTKKAIIDFVGRVTHEGGPDFVPAPERIATFDNDGTLWSEQPLLRSSSLFALDRVKALAPQHPEWKTKQPFTVRARGRHEPRWPRAAKKASDRRSSPPRMPA